MGDGRSKFPKYARLNSQLLWACRKRSRFFIIIFSRALRQLGKNMMQKTHFDKF